MLDFEPFNIFETNNLTFLQNALTLFRFQYQHNALYQQYVNSLNIAVENVKSLNEIPFLPIQFFKNYAIKTTPFEAEIKFTSSGTSGNNTSTHHVKDTAIYKKSFTKALQQFYGNLEDYCIIGLLPSYLERTGSSLIYMVDYLIKYSKHKASNFYLNEHEELFKLLQQLEKEKQPTLLFGVTFGLLDFAAKYSINLKYVTIIETGGMKGRGKELTRQEVHQILQSKFKTTIHSEYGMTELLSQAFAIKDGLFATPNWMKVLVRMQDDPLLVSNYGKGLLNIIDLANIYSCAFIATDDVTKVYPNNLFEVLGRLDNSDTRGCSLLTI
jgi:phenylacetate-coenzyme A ligase PaaK-like adenylate-forming protein